MTNLLDEGGKGSACLSRRESPKSSANFFLVKNHKGHKGNPILSALVVLCGKLKISIFARYVRMDSANVRRQKLKSVIPTPSFLGVRSYGFAPQENPFFVVLVSFVVN
jgi:hypothetical protein